MNVLVVEYDHVPDLHVYERVLGALPGIRLRTASDPGMAALAVPDAHILVAKAHDVTADLVASATALQMVQCLTTGTDALARVHLPAHVVVTSGRGVHGPQMAELAFLMMLSLTRDSPGLARNQAAHRWERRPQPMLAGKTLTILGVGAIAEDVAIRAKAFGMRVTGLSSRTHAPHFDHVHPRAMPLRAAAEADYVLVLSPYTPATHHMVNADFLAAMKPQAFLINLARGGVVDEDALCAALRDGRIAGAGLDVFTREPLPAGSVFWDMPNVMITPHIGGMSDRYAEDIAPLVAHNVLAFSEGRVGALSNRVEGKEGLLFEKRKQKTFGMLSRIL